MRRRVPIGATLVVLAAVAAMIGLGLWQLQRLHWKERQLATYAANLRRAPVALPGLWPVGEGALYRRTSANCLLPGGWRAIGGRDIAGAFGYRHIALCRTGAEGPGFAADIGVSPHPDAPRWRGGVVRGRVTWLPTGETLISRLVGRPAPETPLIVSETAAPGLVASAQPDPGAIPNNHLAYAVQWFIFALIGSVIYALALVRRWRQEGAPKR